MASGLEELVRIRFTGERSVDHALEVSALRVIIQFEVLLNETTAFIRERRPVTQPNHKRRIEIYLRNIEPGSAVVPLQVNADVVKWPEVHGSLQLISRVFNNLSEREPLPEIPRSLALQFRKLAHSLKPNEMVEVTSASNASFPVTRAVGKLIKDYEPDEKKALSIPEMARIPKQLESGGIEAILQSLAADVPREEWQQLPSDLTDELDHYLYGTPKK
jgi:hypothetical protein